MCRTAPQCGLRFWRPRPLGRRMTIRSAASEPGSLRQPGISPGDLFFSSDVAVVEVATGGLVAQNKGFANSVPVCVRCGRGAGLRPTPTFC